MFKTLCPGFFKNMDKNLRLDFREESFNLLIIVE